MKVMAMYLPQYHEVEENNVWWGKGYTEWTSVQKARPLYKGHNQPRVPKNEYYYDLADDDAMAWKWQAELAKQYGIYGFCIYHYWFESGKQLLQRPAEILLEHLEIDIRYSFCWANETWTRTWYNLENEILMEQKYGEEKEWIEHYNYLVRFFKDSRYIRIDNKPVIHIYHSYEIPKLDEMLTIWNKLAKQDGFSGIYVICGNTGSKLEERAELVDAYYNFEPGYTLNHGRSKYNIFKYKLRVIVYELINRFLNKQLLERRINMNEIYSRNYKGNRFYKGKPIYPGSVPMWDNTPRRAHKGLEYTNCSPERFYQNLVKLKKVVHDSPIDYIYVNAWNEWGEGAYLEPDNVNGYEYLEAIKKVLDE